MTQHIKTIEGAFSFSNTNTLGELLRNFWFVESHKDNDDIGCVTTFEVPAEAVPMTKEQRAFFIPYIYSRFDIDEGYEVSEDAFLTEEEKADIEAESQEDINSSKGFILVQDNYRSECFWLWDHDGCLIIRVFKDDQLIGGVINSDCKKTYNWYNFHVPTLLSNLD